MASEDAASRALRLLREELEQERAWRVEESRSYESLKSERDRLQRARAELASALLDSEQRVADVESDLREAEELLASERASLEEAREVAAALRAELDGLRGAAGGGDSSASEEASEAGRDQAETGATTREAVHATLSGGVAPGAGAGPSGDLPPASPAAADESRWRAEVSALRARVSALQSGRARLIVALDSQSEGAATAADAAQAAVEALERARRGEAAWRRRAEEAAGRVASLADMLEASARADGAFEMTLEGEEGIRGDGSAPGDPAAESRKLRLALTRARAEAAAADARARELQHLLLASASDAAALERGIVPALRQAEQRLRELVVSKRSGSGGAGGSAGRH